MVNFFQRASAWLGARTAVRASRASGWVSERAVTGVNKALLLFGLVAGLTIGSVSVANAQQVFDFSYSGSGLSGAGTFITGLPGGCGPECVPVTSITGTANGDPITGTWISGSEGPLAFGPLFGSSFSQNYVQLLITAGGNNYFFGTSFAGTIDGAGGASVCNPYCNFQAVNQTIAPHQDVSVPEITAPAGLGSLAVLFGFVLIFREMLLRRRGMLSGQI